MGIGSRQASHFLKAGQLLHELTAGLLFPKAFAANLPEKNHGRRRCGPDEVCSIRKRDFIRFLFSIAQL
jgi:hypothetical protein